MNSLLRGVLAKRDLWLLEIPRVLLPGRSSAEVLLSRRGAAMGLPWSAFGGLFFTNFLATCLQVEAENDNPAATSTTWRARRLRWRLRRRVPSDLCRHAWTAWLTGQPVTGKAGSAVQRLEDALTFAMKGTDNAGDRTTWAMTTFQQAIMVLHEFGHITALRDADVRDTVHEHAIAAELQADQWGLAYTRRLARRLFGAPSPATEAVMARALLYLYSALEFTEYLEPSDPRREDMAVRCAGYIRALAADSEYASIPDIVVLDFFDTMRRHYQARLPAISMFVVFDHILQRWAKGSVTYENTEVRAMVEPAMTPWGLL